MRVKVIEVLVVLWVFRLVVKHCDSYTVDPFKVGADINLARSHKQGLFSHVDQVTHVADKIDVSFLARWSLERTKLVRHMHALMGDVVAIHVGVASTDKVSSDAEADSS